MKTFAIAAAALFALSAHAHEGDAECHHPEQADAKDAHAKSESKAKGAEGWTLTRGAKLSGAAEVKLAALLADPSTQDGKTVTLEGTVRKACSRKGCWMELATDEKSAGVRVTFKDYGFFVPVDSAGAQARVEGVVKVTELTDAVAAHYASEGAIVPHGKDGKAREVQMVASGVELKR